MILPALSLIGHQNALATKILLATCTRISELAGAKWEHVDLDRAEWVVPHSKGRTVLTIVAGGCWHHIRRDFP